MQRNHLMKKLKLTGLLTIFCLTLFAQENTKTTNPTTAESKTTEAVRIENPLKIDGVLGEPEWLNVPVATDFVENQPTPGTAPTYTSEVKVTYDNTAIYIGAKLYDSQPDSVAKELSQRDRLLNTDWFGVFLDPYQDGINGVSFILTPSGVQFDAKYSTFGEDTSWDAVWEGEAQITEDGWVAEFKIPYSAIRFPKVDRQTWSINFGRRIARLGEKYFWSEVNPEVDGFLNQAGKISGINNIKSPVRLSATPFAATYFQNYYDKNGEPTSSWGRSFNGGMDIKYGINDAFTLDMTLIPDFGEARSDNQVLNLSPFEVRFNENRQFFTEGVELFNKGGLFYSRRLGGRPLNQHKVYNELKDGETIVENPSNVQLLNATKISGRTNSGLGIGFLNATAAETNAIIENPELGQREVMTSPLTNYNVLVFDQNLKNNSFATLINTTVLRSGADYDANVTGGVLRLNNKKRSYQFSAEGALSQKYFSNSDTDLGHSFEIEFGKTNGNLNFELGYSEESDTYDPNDLGFLYNNNERQIDFWVNYNQYKPFLFFNRGNVGLWTGYTRLYAPNEFAQYGINAWAWGQTKNFFNIEVWGYGEPVEAVDWFEARTPGRFYKEPTNINGGFWMSTDQRKAFQIQGSANFQSHNEPGRGRIRFSIGPRYRVSDKFNFNMNISRSRFKNDVGYVNSTEAGEVIFGRRNRTVVVNNLNVNYTFTNNMALTFRGRHYWQKVNYKSYHLLEENGRLGATAYNGDHNSRFNAFTIDMIYRWRFAPGSDIFIVWKNSIFGADNLIEMDYFENTRGLFENPQTNSLSVKVVYFLDYLNVVKPK